MEGTKGRGRAAQARAAIRAYLADDGIVTAEQLAAAIRERGHMGLVNAVNRRGGAQATLEDMVRHAEAAGANRLVEAAIREAWGGR